MPLPVCHRQGLSGSLPFTPLTEADACANPTMTTVMELTSSTPVGRVRGFQKAIGRASERP